MTTGNVRIGSLFSGYGGLAERWPEVPNLGDITAVDWTTVGSVNVLTGGFPCQDVSSAGKRAGLRPDNRSGLWSQMAYAVSVLRPRLVIAENVRGLLSAPAASDMESCPWCLGNDTDHALRALGAVLGDLANLGYDTAWCGLRASDVGAPHQRFRVFVAATDAHQSRREGQEPTSGHDLSARSPAANPQGKRHRDARPSSLGTVPETSVSGDQRGTTTDADGGTGDSWRGAASRQAPSGRPRGGTGRRRLSSTADTEGHRRQERRAELSGQQGRRHLAIGGGRSASHTSDGYETDKHPMGAASGGPGWRVGTEPGAGARTGARHPAPRVPDLGGRSSRVDFGGYEPAIQRWEHVLGRLAPAPTIDGQRRSQVLNPAFVEWMQGVPVGWVTNVPHLSRNAMLRILGNGVVPQQAAAALPWLLEALDAPLGEVA